MQDERYVFEGLDGLGGLLRRKAKDIGYLAIWDRTDRTTEEPLGRFDFTVEDALPYLVRDEDLDDAPDDDDDLADEPDDDDGPPDPSDDPAARALRAFGRQPGPADFAIAAVRWVRDIAVRNMGGDELRRFRLKVYLPKGVRALDTRSFACRDDDASASKLMVPAVEPMPDLRIPSPSFEHVEVTSTARGMRALGDYYAQWGQIVLGSVGQLQGVNNAMLGRLHVQLQESRGQVDQLVAAILTHRATEAELAEQRRSSDRSEDARTQLAHQALTQVGEAAKAFLASRGVTPELADALGAIGQSPELVATLNDPDVRVLMHDPQNLKMLAGLLRQAAAQSKALREAAPPTNNS
jgi:hypothetical protein